MYDLKLMEINKDGEAVEVNANDSKVAWDKCSEQPVPTDNS